MGPKDHGDRKAKSERADAAGWINPSKSSVTPDTHKAATRSHIRAHWNKPKAWAIWDLRHRDGKLPIADRQLTLVAHSNNRVVKPPPSIAILKAVKWGGSASPFSCPLTRYLLIVYYIDLIIVSSCLGPRTISSSDGPTASSSIATTTSSEGALESTRSLIRSSSTLRPSRRWLITGTELILVLLLPSSSLACLSPKEQSRRISWSLRSSREGATIGECIVSSWLSEWLLHWEIPAIVFRDSCLMACQETRWMTLSNTTLPLSCSTAPSGNTSSKLKQSPQTYDPPINPYQIIYHPTPYNDISINYQLFTSKSMDSSYHKFKYPQPTYRILHT